MAAQTGVGGRIARRAQTGDAPGACDGRTNLESMRTPDIELLWWDGCPSTERARAELEEALEEVGLDRTRLKTTEIRTDGEAAGQRFVGSPTVRIDGLDVAPPEAGELAGLTCRVYHRRDGRISPTPDPQDLREALRRALENKEEVT